jgi:hypothetical protein
VAEDRADEVATRGIFVLDERNRARNRPRIARQNAVGECHRDKSWRAMTSRWISLVPSPMVVSFTSRKYFRRVILHEPVAAVDLHAVFGDPHRRLARIQLRHRRLERRPPAAILQVRGAIGQQPAASM